MNPRTGCRWLLFLIVLIIFLSVICPLFFPNSELAHLDGSPSAIDHWDIWISIGNPLTSFVYLLGDILCHQEMERCFVINGAQMPFCIRDMTIMIGIIVSLISWDHLEFRHDPAKVTTVATSLMLIGCMVAEWYLKDYVGTYELSLRIVTGMLAGTGIGTLLRGYVSHHEKHHPSGE